MCSTKDKLFEQIANVERPKEFGCEFGRGFDLIRWGFFYDASRLQQLKEHSVVRLGINFLPTAPVSYSEYAGPLTLNMSLPSHPVSAVIAKAAVQNTDANLLICFIIVFANI